MFVFLFPCGMSVRLSRRGLVSYVLLGLILYRLIGALLYPRELSVIITQMLPPETWNAEFLTALLQSLVTPVTKLPPPFEMSGGAYTWALGLILIFWLIFGPPLEDRMGRGGFVLFFLAGAVLSAALCSLPHFGQVPAFWLGHGATLFLVGVCYHQFLTDEVKVYYLFFLWFPWINKSGIARISSLLVLAPIHIMAALCLSPIWFHPRGPLTAALISSGVWAFLLPFLGTGASWILGKVRGNRQVSEETTVMG